MRAREVLRFDHAKHRTETKTDCVRCHADAGSGAAILRPKMAECLSCHGHDDEFMAKDCQACHVDLQTEGTVPEDHFVHSPTFGSDHASVAAHADSMCATCHSERTCAACHAGDMMPAAPERLAFDTPGMGGLHAAGFLARHADESANAGGLCTSCHAPRELLELSRARAAPVEAGRRRDPPRRSTRTPRRLDRPTGRAEPARARGVAGPRGLRGLPWRRWGAAVRQLPRGRRRRGATRTRRARVRAATSRPGRASLATSEAAEVAARGASSARLLHLAPLLAAVAIATACGLMGGGDDAEDAAPPPKDPHAGLDAKAAHAGDAKAAHAGRGAYRCSACHDMKSPDEAWRSRAMKMGHDVSEHTGAGTHCTCCHLGEIEGFGEPAGERCAECHEDVDVAIPRMAEEHCLACHDLEGSGDVRTTAWECQKCHGDEDAAVPLIDVHGTQACESCHQPHDEPWVKERKCSDCHEGKDHVLHGAHGREQQLVCSDCHEPHEAAGEASGRCVPCHEEEQPKVFTAATLFDGHDTCTSCHEPHGFEKASAGSCTSCHADHVMTDVPAAHQACGSCHQTHAPRSVSAATCKGCHDTVSVEHADGATEVCTTCHDPHGGSKGHAAGAAACTQLPRRRRRQRPRARHERLLRDLPHTPHQFVAAKAPGCEGCHQQQHKESSKHAACGSCHGDAHDPHAGSGSCSSCHAEQHKSMTKGHGPCTQCHDGHDKSLLAKATSCEGCHAGKSAGPHDGVKGSCASCHRPPRPLGGREPAWLRYVPHGHAERRRDARREGP
jgi:hypothetical protein